MMRKVIMFAACAAAGMIVASCSSEDALTEIQQPEAEKGTPLN